MTTAPKRRWLRFSLRTIFVAVTVVGIWLGYEANWIRQRREFIHTENADLSVVAHFWRERHDAPLMLRLLGEEGYDRIAITFRPQESFDQQARDRFHVTEKQKQTVRLARQLFPEAEYINGGVLSEERHYFCILLSDDFPFEFATP